MTTEHAPNIGSFLVAFLIAFLFGCGESETEQNRFLKRLKTIYDHENLADINVVESTLGVKFKKSVVTNPEVNAYQLTGQIPSFASEHLSYSVRPDMRASLQIESIREKFCVDPSDIEAVFGAGKVVSGYPTIALRRQIQISVGHQKVRNYQGKGKLYTDFNYTYLQHKCVWSFAISQTLVKEN